MIHNLHGIRETVDYENNSTFVLIYDNNEYEDYPYHWHTAAEIIMPIENWYEVCCAEKNISINHFKQFVSLFDYINLHFSENLNLENVAKMTGFSKYYFERLFKQITGVSFYKYINRKRIVYAVR